MALGDGLDIELWYGVRHADTDDAASHREEDGEQDEEDEHADVIRYHLYDNADHHEHGEYQQPEHDV